MDAGTFRAVVRARGFRTGDAIHVTENLRVCDPAITRLCDHLKVSGDLNLSGCGSLQSLPDWLSVSGDLIVDDCKKLQRLPENLRKVNEFRARNCTALTSIEPLRLCRGPTTVTGCAMLQPLPSDFRSMCWVSLDGCTIHHHAICLEGAVPDTVMIAAVGRRVGDLIDHRLLSGHSIKDEFITEVEFDEELNETCFYIDASSLVI